MCHKFDPKLRFSINQKLHLYLNQDGKTASTKKNLVSMAKKVSRPKLVKDWDKMPKDIVAAIKAEYPNGFSHKLITYTTPKGEKVLALPYDTEAIDYLVRVTIMESKNIQRDDDDDDDITAVVKTPREDLPLDDLDIEGLVKEDDSFSSVDDEEEDDYIKPSRRRRNNDDEDESDDDY